MDRDEGGTVAPVGGAGCAGLLAGHEPAAATASGKRQAQLLTELHERAHGHDRRVRGRGAREESAVEGDGVRLLGLPHSFACGIDQTSRHQWRSRSVGPAGSRGRRRRGCTASAGSTRGRPCGRGGARLDREREASVSSQGWVSGVGVSPLPAVAIEIATVQVGLHSAAGVEGPGQLRRRMPSMSASRAVVHRS